MHIQMDLIKIVFRTLVSLFSYQEIISAREFLSCPMENNFNYVKEAAFDVIFSCYIQNDTTVIVTGKLDDTLIKSVEEFATPFNIIILDPTITFSVEYTVIEKNHALFVVVATTNEDLNETFLFLKNTRFWDIERTFFIIGRNNEKNECRNAHNFLRQSWNHNILHLIFICNQENQVLLYTLNPFVNIAPHPWKLAETSTTLESNSWTIYKRPYLDDSNICVNLSFDKTQELNGYKVKIAGSNVPPYLEIPPWKVPSFDNILGSDGSTFRCVLPYLNTTISFKYTNDGILGHVSRNGSGIGLFKELSSGIHDIVLNPSYMYSAFNTTISLPHANTGLVILAYPTKPKTTLSKILGFLGYRLLIATFLVTVLTLIVLHIFNRESILMTILEGVRLLGNGPILRLPLAVQARMIIGTTFLFFLIFQAIFQGKLAALLTQQVSEKNLETEKDLIDCSGHKIYVAKSHVQYLDEQLNQKIIIIPEITCINRILNNNNSVCISDLRILRTYAVKYKLHLSKTLIRQTLLVYRMRKDWPLRQRFINVIMIVQESGLYSFWQQKASNFSKYEVNNQLDDYKNAEFTTVKFNDLAFAFKFLSFGLGFGSLTFLAEIWFPRIIKITMRRMNLIM